MPLCFLRVKRKWKWLTSEWPKIALPEMTLSLPKMTKILFIKNNEKAMSFGETRYIDKLRFTCVQYGIEACASFMRAGSTSF